jgi:Ca2+-binding EF-hand superfamily protein
MRLMIATAALLAAAAAQAGGTYGENRDHMASLDTNSDGLISREEAKAYPRLAEHFDEIDTNKDGQISHDEMEAHHKQWHQQMREEARERFKAADTDGDGALNLAEAQTGMPKLAEKFSEIDTNNDGKVTPDEIRAARKHGAP